MTARQVDENGYINIKNNPITRAGVFQYLESSVIAGGDPGKIVNVYRPASELEDPACQDSFKLLPLVDDHTMLGPSSEGHTPAEKKGTHGITGQDIAFKDGVLYSNLKIFSETLATLIEKGKTDLSLGYRCIYDKVAGIFGGQTYDYVQRSLRGNHIALVDNARCAVGVLDHNSVAAFDHFDLNLKQEKENTMTPEELAKRLAAMDASITALTTQNATLKAALDAAEEEKKKEKEAEDEEMSEEEKKKKAEDEAAEADKKKAEDEDTAKKDGDEKKAMDAKISAMDAEIAGLKKGGLKALLVEQKSRDSLAQKISEHVGTFDHSEMTADEVAAYGAEKLGLKVAKGQERIALDGFFHNRPAPAEGAAFAFDSASTTGDDPVDAFLNKKS